MSAVSGGPFPTCKPRRPKVLVAVVVAARTAKLRRVVVLHSIIGGGVWCWGGAKTCLWMCWVGWGEREVKDGQGSVEGDQKW
jgi:hypothetical protein